MGGRDHPLVDAVALPAAGENLGGYVVSNPGRIESAAPRHRDRERRAMAPFLAGAAVGAAAGVVAGTLLSRHAVHLIAALIGAVDRRLSHEDRDHLRSELLLQ